jgi:hypothetical protein
MFYVGMGGIELRVSSCELRVARSLLFDSIKG